MTHAGHPSCGAIRRSLPTPRTAEAGVETKNVDPRFKAGVCAAVLMTPALVGCVFVWGGSYHIASESPTAVAIDYDPSLANSSTIWDVAKTRCAQHQRIAVPKRQWDVGPLGIMQITFTCDTAEEAERDRPIQLYNLTISFSPVAAPPSPSLPSPADYTLHSQPPAPPAPLPLPDLGTNYAPPPPPPPTQFIPYDAVAPFMPGISPNGTAR